MITSNQYKCLLQPLKDTCEFKTSEELSAFVEKNCGLGIDYWKKHYANSFNFPEALSITYLALTHAARNYNSQKGKFSTFAYIYLRKYFILELDAKNKLRNDYEELDVNYDASDNGKNAQSSQNQIDISAIREHLFKNGITQDEYDLFYDKFYNNMSASKLSIKYSSKFNAGIQHTLKKIRKKIREVMSNA